MNGLGNQKGMNLIEVMIALAIFAIFVTAFMSGQGSNLRDSYMMKEEITMRTLAEEVINEIIVDPPELREALTLRPETRNFEHNANYSYSIEWSKFEIQNILNALTQGNNQDYDPEAVSRRQMQERINEQIASNLEQLVWQLMVTITDNTTGETFSISTLLYNQNAQVNFGNF